MTAAEKKLKLKNLAVAAVFTALICVISPLSLYIGPIPYSLATIPIFICGAFLSPAYAFGCSLCHLAIGAMGLPVFSNFSGGIGAVTGATWPEELRELRARLPHTFFLVPGYGAQGGTAEDVQYAFDQDGRGAIVNASRSIMCAWQKTGKDGADFQEAARAAAETMRDAIGRYVTIR